ncbi:NAD(P)-binding protein [Lentithecium fluviatile CBS 122367]|uniref:NAD(P)-binding protein n=1 Tax=Lentithecium fluviatile CBS 122367 TaxID=1168545 RepID=A0A6G1J3B4_9PLEO|nr:NAD(P)-binding protein [Lentithecium fluviatile CBS 122367]
MTPLTVILVTGVSRGIGKAVAAAYLARPNHIVIGSVRDAKAPQAEDLKKLSTGDGSRLLLVSIENASRSDPKKAVQDIEAAGIDHVDIVISSAGVSPGPAPLDAVDPEVVVETFNINAVSSIVLFQAVNKLLVKSAAPKWISVSSRAGSIGAAVDFYYYVGAYGVSKAAQNWFTKTLHFGNPSLTAFAVHPGFVHTDMGVAAANAAGIDLPATSAEESATKLLEVIDSATREATSRKLIDIITGEEYLW